jgi:hypothetical protein
MRDAIERALKKEAEDRWPTAAALRDALVADGLASSWRAPEQHEAVRYVSPRRLARRRDRHGATTSCDTDEGAAGGPAALARTGRSADRIKAMRGYTLLTLAWSRCIAGFVAGFTDAPPLVFAPVVPIYMCIKVWRRAISLRLSGLRLRRVLFMPRAHWALPSPKPSPIERELAKLAPRDVLDSPDGAALRQAVEDRAAISEIVGGLSKGERAMLPDLTVTVNALVERIAHLAQTLYRLGQDMDSRLAPRLAEQREALRKQLESAGLALQNIRVDLIRFRSSGVQSALSDASSATQQARALSREIATALEAVSEVRNL